MGKDGARQDESDLRGVATLSGKPTALEVFVYDYIIVGAGSAGSVVAARLTEDPSTSVLVLEGGPPDDVPEIAMPGAAPTLWSGPLTWDNLTVPQRHAAQRVLSWSSGRTLGGSSSINGMIYVRGNRVDYDDWRDAHGCTGWGYADVLSYFLRAEDQQRSGSRYHGVGGPLRVEDQRYEHPLSRAWLEAAVASGLPRNEDFNGPDQDGVGHYQMTQRGGRRWSVADAYLRPAMRRPNLTVESGARVDRLVLEGERATGVHYVRDGATRTARASREVVVACGAVNTPQLLMLSGIGPADHLRAHHIPVVVDAPGVGVGLQDHPMCLPGWRAPTTPNLWEEATPENVELWRRERRGPMTSFGAEAGGFARSGDRPAPDLQFGAIPGPRRSPSSVHPPSGRSGPSSAPCTCGAAAGFCWPPPPPRPGRSSIRPTSPTRPTWRCWSPGSAWPGRSPPASRWRASSTGRSCPARTSTTTSGSGSGFAPRPARCSTRPGPAPWAAPPRPCATPSCACGAWRACAWWTPR